MVAEETKVADRTERQEPHREVRESQDMTKDAASDVRSGSDPSPAHNSGKSKQQEQEEEHDREEELCDNDWSTISTRSSFHLPSVPDGLLDLNFETDAELESSPETDERVALP